MGRGFDPGALTGDQGFGFQLEGRIDPFRLSRKSTVGVQPYLFLDQAWLWTKGVAGGAQKLSSLGGGARFTLPGRARLDIGLAAPIRQLPGETRRRDVRGLVSLTTTILPWRTR